MRKRLIGALICGLAVVSLLGCGEKKDDSNFVEVDIKPNEVYVDGVIFEVPARVQTYMDNGFSFGEHEDNVYEPGGSDSIRFCGVDVKVENAGNQDRAFRDCNVYALYANNILEECKQITVIEGITIGRTNAKEVKELLGEPDDIYKSKTGIYYTYKDYKDTGLGYEFKFTKRGKKVEYVQISTKDFKTAREMNEEYKEFVKMMKSIK